MDSVEVQLKVLMLAGLAGDAKAHQQMLAAAATRLRAYFGRRLGTDASDVEDLVQEALIAIHSRRESYNPTLPFTAWLHGIARHKLIDHFRRSGLRTHVLLEDVDEPAAADDIGPALAAVDVDRLLMELPEKHRTAIRLTRLDGYSVAEASRLTGWSPSGIKIGVHRGLKKMTRRVRGDNDSN